MENVKVKLGMKVRDVVNQIEGIVDQYHTTLFGVDRVCVQPPKSEKNEMAQAWIFDHNLVEIIESKLITELTPIEPKFKLGAKLKCKLTKQEGIYSTHIKDLGGCNRCVITLDGFLDDKGRAKTFVAQEEQFKEIIVPKEKVIVRTGNDTGCNHVASEW